MLDLLIVNGHVIDPANNVDEVRPVAIYNGQIVRYEEGEQARHTIDAAGKYVFPGLIDAHAHMFSEGTDIGTYPDLTYLPTGESHELPNRESEILERLCRHPHAVVPAKDILLDLWGDDDFFCTRSFQTLISRLRHRLSKDPDVKLINQRGEGYRLLY